MKSPTTEMIDLALTQALERYMEMDPSDVYEAIVHEWPEQTAALLTDFFYGNRGGTFGVQSGLIEIPRTSGGMTYYVPKYLFDTSDT